jgi:hypothetical protein
MVRITLKRVEERIELFKKLRIMKLIKIKLCKYNKVFNHFLSIA